MRSFSFGLDQCDFFTLCCFMCHASSVSVKQCTSIKIGNYPLYLMVSYLVFPDVLIFATFNSAGNVFEYGRTALMLSSVSPFVERKSSIYSRYLCGFRPFSFALAISDMWIALYLAPLRVAENSSFLRRIIYGLMPSRSARLFVISRCLSRR